MAILLAALAECGNINVTNILKEQRTGYFSCTTTVNNEGADEIPNVGTNISMGYTLIGHDAAKGKNRESCESVAR